MLTQKNQSKIRKEKQIKTLVTNISCLMSKDERQEMREFCQRLSSLNLADFLMKIQFNNGEVCCFSNKESSKVLRKYDVMKLVENFKEETIFRTERYSPECNFVFIATRMSDTTSEIFLKKGWSDQFDDFCLGFIEKIKSIILNYYMDYKNAYVFNSIAYLTEVIRNKTSTSPSLTTRERQCLLAAMDGLSTKETARKLGISHLTVRCYLEKVREKLNSSTITEAVGRALFQGEIGRIFAKKNYEALGG